MHLCIVKFDIHYRKKEGNVLFNDALNAFYLRLFGYMVKDHSDCERGNPLSHMGYSIKSHIYICVCVCVQPTENMTHYTH